MIRSLSKALHFKAKPRVSSFDGAAALRQVTAAAGFNVMQISPVSHAIADRLISEQSVGQWT
jgi:hypothetical protein